MFMILSDVIHITLFALKVKLYIMSFYLGRRPTTKAIRAYSLFHLYVIPEMSVLFTWHVSSLPFLRSSARVIACLCRNKGHSVRSYSNWFYCIVQIFLSFFFLLIYCVRYLNRLSHQSSSYNL